MEVFCQKHLGWSLFPNKVVGWKRETLVKKRLQLRCFPANFVDFLNTFFVTHLRKAGTKAPVIQSLIKTSIRYFYQIFIFSPNDSPWKTMKNAFYFIKKALFVLKIIKFFYFCLPLFFSLSAIASEINPR